MFGTLRTLVLAVAVVAGGSVVAGCSGEKGGGEAPGASPIDEAKRLVQPGEVLPPRAEAVAIADQVAVAGTRQGGAEGAATLAVAAALRERVYRIDHKEADVREAILLQEQARDLATGTEAGCAADLAAARLRGELAASGEATYREVYLTKRRQRALLADARGACLQEVERLLGLLTAVAPTGPARAVLEKEGDRAATAATAAPAVLATASATAVVSAEPAIGADVVVAPTGVPKPTGPVKITKIERFGGEGAGRVVIHTSAPTTFAAGALAAEGGKSPRVYVDVDVASAKGIARETSVGGAIERVRVGARDGGGTRVVLDLSRELHKRVFYLPEPFRIVVDISARAPQEAVAAAGGPRTVTRVAIDPGHGGDDAGAVGPTGLKEKDVTLDIAHRVAPILAHELKIETMLTRDTDVFVPLDERAARANAFHADLFLSIHCNASENGEARGVEIFVLDELKDVSRASSRVAALENGWRGSALDDGRLDAEMARIFSGLRSGETAARSRKLGDLLLRATQASLSARYGDTRDHGIKSAAFFVLAGAEMPAVLFETSFISNPTDEQRLGTADYRQKLADGVVNAVRAYRDGK